MVAIKKEDRDSPSPENFRNSYISDESSFYGDDEEKADLELEASSFKTLPYWETIHPFALATIAETQRASALKSLEDRPANHDPFKGREEFRQLAESIPEFIQRLPPSSTYTSAVGPFIFISNPHVHHRVTDSDIRGFSDAGQALLDAFEDREDKGRGKVGAQRRKLEADILACACEHNVVSGKWMLFPPERKVDEIWAAVAGATAKGNLGIQAKVAAKDESSDNGHQSWGRLICVYTKDFADKEDIRRVLVKLVDMGLVANKPIYYKCNAYTYLDIRSKNRWGIAPSMFSSSTML